MTHPERSPVLIGALMMLLAACGGTASSATTPAASSATPVATAAALVRGEFAGHTGAMGIALSTNGKQVVAYICNGTPRSVTLAQWFSGPVTDGKIGITNPHGTHLAAIVTAKAITGTITLKNGSTTAFTANLVTNLATNPYGLYRSEETFNGTQYLAGWIISDPQGPGCCMGVSHDRIEGGILVVKTGALIPSPMLTTNTASVTVPGVGTFKPARCVQSEC